MLRKALHFFRLDRLWVRLMLINICVLLVPIFGMEFAHIYEKELLRSLEQKMRDQAALWRLFAEQAANSSGLELEELSWGNLPQQTMSATNLGVRILDTHGEISTGPASDMMVNIRQRNYNSGHYSSNNDTQHPWPPIPDRYEVRQALSGKRSARARLTPSGKALILSVAEPIRIESNIVGVVYVQKSTREVMARLYRIRRGLLRILLLTLCLCVSITLLIAWWVSKPLNKLAMASHLLTHQKQLEDEHVKIDASAGPYEIRLLTRAFNTMSKTLSEKMTYIEQFVADVAHEIKSPLTSIGGAAELIADDAEALTPKQQQFVSNIQLDVDRLAKLVTRLLELGRIASSSEEKSIIVLQPLLESIVEEMTTVDAVGPAGATTPKSRSISPAITLNCHPPTLSISARENELKSALRNLVDNALRYAAIDTPITISANLTESDISVDSLINDNMAEGKIMISVSNIGPRIDPRDIPKLFNRFFTTDRDNEGTGLGLAIAFAVADSHQGTITVDSNTERTTFSLTLPV